MPLPKRFRPVVVELGFGAGRNGQYNLTRSGFPRSTEELGGPVVLDPSVAFKIKVEGERVPPRLYLRGAVSETYTGRGWRAPRGNYSEQRAAVPMPSTYATGVSLKTVTVTVTPVDLRSTTVSSVPPECAPWPST